MLCALLLAALTTEAIGVHAIFGAFLFGAVLALDSSLARELRRSLEHLVTILTAAGLLCVYRDADANRARVGPV